MKQRRSSAESDAALDQYIAEARAGAPDLWLRQKASVSEEAVLKWRSRRGIRRVRARRNTDIGTWALDVLRQGHDGALHTTGSTVLRGLWEIPEFVLRIPLDYDEFCRLCYSLLRIGEAPSDVARAFGVREPDVITAVELQSAWLQEHGEDCGCGLRFDPSRGPTCQQCKGARC